MIIKYKNKKGARSILICKNCKNQFETLQIKINAGKEKFCSKECYFSFRLLNKKDRKYQNKIYQKKNKYNLSEIEYLDLIKSNKCDICQKEFSLQNRDIPLVDHCHKTNKIRGVLCHNCNLALGLFKDDIKYLQRAINYLIKK